MSKSLRVYPAGVKHHSARSLWRGLLTSPFFIPGKNLSIAILPKIEDNPLHNVVSFDWRLVWLIPRMPWNPIGST